MSDLKKPEKVQNLINKFCITIGMIPTSYKESLSYEGQILAIGNYLEKVVYPAINTNAEALEELQSLFIELKNYVDNYFENLDVQDEINNKLDEMVESGTLADIINQQIFGDLNDAINANTENINNLRNDSIRYPFYDIKKNGGFDDGSTPNDTIFSNAKNNGYRKFYFPQNADNNANYYFTETPDFNDCEIITDDGVTINFPNPSGINSTHNAKFKNNVKMYSRQQSRSFNIPKNESDFFNQFSLPNYCMKNTLIHGLDYNTLRMFHYSYGGGIYQESNKNTYFQKNGYDIRYKANDVNSEFSILAVPFDTNKNECIEIVTTPNTHIAFGCVDTNSMHGMYCQYTGRASGGYFSVNGTPQQQISYNFSTLSNIFSHNGQNVFNNNWVLPIKFKLRNDKIMNQIQLFVNDNFVQSIPYTVSPDYWGFGINENETPTLSPDIGFSEILQYEQDICPLNSSLNILIAGDSRMYGYNTQYHIEDVIENGLKNNGINVTSITNISVSGWSMENIYDAIREQDLSQYDIVIVPTGINNLYSSYQSILELAYNIQNYCANNKCFCIMPATIPVGYGATDALANRRAEVYYRIQQAILSSNGYVTNKRLCQIIPNVMGTTVLSNNIEVCSDGVHPTTEGTILFAKSIVNTILHLLD